MEKRTIRERFIAAIIDMSIGEKVIYNHKSYKLIVKKVEQDQDIEDPNLIV